MGRKSAKAGLAASGVTGVVLTGITATLSGPAANLGGYATAQIVASALGLGALGIGGPALSVVIAAVGGPVVAGGLAVAAVGGTVYGGAKLVKKILR
jgi:hypothetical protein